MDFSLTAEQLEVQALAREFSAQEVEPRADAIDRAGRMPDDLMPKLADIGLLGMTVPKRYGGHAWGHLTCIISIEQLAYSGTGAWWLAAFNNSIPDCVARYAPEQVRRKYLPSLCQGQTYASIQFTEEATGSDPAALTTTSVRERDHFLVTGSKRFSTFGARNGVAILFAKNSAGACTALLAEKMRPGYNAGKVWETLGGGGIEAVDVSYDAYSVPVTHLLGRDGQGFDVLLDWIAVEKVQQCAANVGMAQAALDEAIRYANARVSRGRPTSAMQGIRWMLADMEGKLQASRWLTYRAAALLDEKGSRRTYDAALAKVFVVPATIEVTEMARRIHGAYGYTREYKIERLCRAAAGATGVATTLEVNKSIVGSALVKNDRADVMDRGTPSLYLT